MQKTLEMRLRVTYDDAENIPTQELAGVLYRAAQHLANEGLLSGESDAIVDDWRVNVEEVGPAGLRFPR
jgi:hypothetical protein